MSARTWRPDGPGSFQAPHDIHAVHDRAGRVWRRSRARWTANGSHFIRWRTLVAEHGPLTEAPARPSYALTATAPNGAPR